MTDPTTRPDPATKRDKARAQDASGPVTDSGHPLEDAGVSNEELRHLEDSLEAPPADEEVAKQMLEEERDEETREEESDEGEG